MLTKKQTTDVSTSTRNLTHLERDRGYRFQDRDPILEEIARLITDSGLSLWRISELTKTSNLSSVSTGTLSKWCSGGVRYPYNIKVEAVLKALGYRKREIIKDNRK